MQRCINCQTKRYWCLSVPMVYFVMFYRTSKKQTGACCCMIIWLQIPFFLWRVYDNFGKAKLRRCFRTVGQSNPSSLRFSYMSSLTSLGVSPWLESSKCVYRGESVVNKYTKKTFSWTTWRSYANKIWNVCPWGGYFMTVQCNKFCDI